MTARLAGSWHCATRLMTRPAFALTTVIGAAWLVLTSYVAVRYTAQLLSSGTDAGLAAEMTARLRRLAPSHLSEATVSSRSLVIPICAMVCAGRLTGLDYAHGMVALLVARGRSRWTLAVERLAAVLLVGLAQVAVLALAALVGSVATSGEGAALHLPDLARFAASSVACWIIWAATGWLLSAVTQSSRWVWLLAIASATLAGPLVQAAPSFGQPWRAVAQLSPFGAGARVLAYGADPFTVIALTAGYVALIVTVGRWVVLSQSLRVRTSAD